MLCFWDVVVTGAASVALVLAVGVAVVVVEAAAVVSVSSSKYNDQAPPWMLLSAVTANSSD